MRHIRYRLLSGWRRGKPIVGEDVLKRETVRAARAPAPFHPGRGGPPRCMTARKRAPTPLGGDETKVDRCLRAFRSWNTARRPAGTEKSAAGDRHGSAGHLATQVGAELPLIVRPPAERAFVLERAGVLVPGSSGLPHAGDGHVLLMSGAGGGADLSLVVEPPALHVLAGGHCASVAEGAGIRQHFSRQGLVLPGIVHLELRVRAPAGELSGAGTACAAVLGPQAEERRAAQRHDR